MTTPRTQYLLMCDKLSTEKSELIRPHVRFLKLLLFICLQTFIGLKALKKDYPKFWDLYPFQPRGGSTSKWTPVPDDSAEASILLPSSSKDKSTSRARSQAQMDNFICILVPDTDQTLTVVQFNIGAVTSPENGVEGKVKVRKIHGVVKMNDASIGFVCYDDDVYNKGGAPTLWVMATNIFGMMKSK